jgi:hypothetical protein
MVFLGAEQHYGNIFVMLCAPRKEIPKTFGGYCLYSDQNGYVLAAMKKMTSYPRLHEIKWYSG